MQIIPVQAVKSQTLQVILAGQKCSINLYQKYTGLYLDLYVNFQPVICGVICQNLNPIVRSVYLGFTGDLAFIDSQGADDPDYAGLGTRYYLAYLEASDISD